MLNRVNNLRSAWELFIRLLLILYILDLQTYVHIFIQHLNLHLVFLWLFYMNHASECIFSTFILPRNRVYRVFFERLPAVENQTCLLATIKVKM